MRGGGGRKEGWLPFAIRRGDLFMFQRAPFCSLRNISMANIRNHFPSMFPLRIRYTSDGKYKPADLLSFH